MIQVDIIVDGRASAAQLERVRKGLSDRQQLHDRIAGEAEQFTKDYVRGLDEHRTARRLGARPTNHLEQAATRIESAADAQGARLFIPRRTRLRAAFGSYVVRPTGGRKYLAIPDDARTYGKSPREIAEPLRFAVVGGRHKALVFEATGEVAYWLRPEVTIPEDRGLLPFDELPGLAADVAEAYVEELSEGGAA